MPIASSFGEHSHHRSNNNTYRLLRQQERRHPQKELMIYPENHDFKVLIRSGVVATSWLDRT